MKTLIIMLALVTAPITAAFSQEVIYLLRHAEKAISDPDPDLLPEGRERAKRWARMLRSSGITRIYTSTALRTRETGRIIAESLDLPLTAIDARDITGLVDALQFDHEGEAVLVVGHAETLPILVGQLGVPNDIEIPPGEFDNLLIVSHPGSQEPSLVRLRMP